MKPKTLLLTLLFLPYLFGAFAIPFTGMRTDSTLHTVFAGLSIVYTFGIAFWGIPYTVLLVGILFWSRGKSAKEVYAVLSHAPLWLALITAVELFVVFLYWGLTSQVRFSPVEDLLNLVWYSCIAVFVILIYGYAIVFLSKGVYKVFEYLSFIKDEKDMSEEASSLRSESTMGKFKDSED